MIKSFIIQKTKLNVNLNELFSKKSQQQRGENQKKKRKKKKEKKKRKKTHGASIPGNKSPMIA